MGVGREPADGQPVPGRDKLGHHTADVGGEVVPHDHERAGELVVRGAMFWMTFDGTMNSALFTEFLDLLLHDIDGKIFLIVDNVRYHTSKETSEWVEERKDRIELFFLPSYSPDLNPDEMTFPQYELRRASA